MSVIQVVIGRVFYLDVKSFDCVEAGSFRMVMQYFHNVVNRTERMCAFIVMLCKLGGVAVNSESMFVFVISYCEIPSNLSNIGFVAVRA